MELDEEDSDYPREFLLKYPTEPPPAYTSGRMTKDKIKEEETTSTKSKEYQFIPDTPISHKIKNNQFFPGTDTSSDDDDQDNNFGGMSSFKTNSIKTALGNNFFFNF